MTAVLSTKPDGQPTPGQAAYEARRRLTAERIGEAIEDFGVAWAAQSDANRNIEEAAAQAAITAWQAQNAAAVLAEPDGLDQLAALDDEAESRGEITVSTTFTWDYRQQPPMEAIANRVRQLSSGTVIMELPETGTDEYELTISRAEPQP